MVTVAQVANEALTGILNTVSSLTNVFGRRLLRDDSAAAGWAGRQLLQASAPTNDSSVSSSPYARITNYKHRLKESEQRPFAVLYCLRHCVGMLRGIMQNGCTFSGEKPELVVLHSCCFTQLYKAN